MEKYVREVIEKAVSSGEYDQIKSQLSQEEKEVFFDPNEEEEILEITNSDYYNIINVYKNLLSTEEALASLPRISSSIDMKRIAIIFALPTDQLKMQCLTYLDDEDVKLEVIKEFENDENKKVSAETLPIQLRAELSESLSINAENDDYRIGLIENWPSEQDDYTNWLFSIVKKLSTDDLKIRYLDRLDDEDEVSIFLSLQSSEYRQIAFDKMSLNSKYIISSNKNLESTPENNKYRVETLEEMLKDSKIWSSYYVSEVIIKLPDELKMQYLDRVNDAIKKEIFRSLKTLENKEKVFNKMSNILDKSDCIDEFPIDAKYDKYRIDVAREWTNSPSIFLEIIQDLSTDDLKLELIDEYIKAGYTFGISKISNTLKSIKSCKNKMYIFNKLPQREKYRAMEINRTHGPLIQPEFDEYIMKTVDKNWWKDILSSLEMFENEDQKATETKKDVLIQAIMNCSSTKTVIDVINFVLANQNISTGKIRELGNLMERFKYSNATELLGLESQLVPLILETDNPIETFNKIEKTFIKNNLPMMAKIYQCFKYLYPDFSKKDKFGLDKFYFSDNSRVSPELNNPKQTREMQAVSRDADSTSIRFQIVYNDLIRITSRSNNRSLNEYLKNIRQGNALFLGITNGIISYDSLNDHSKQILSTFSKHLDALYEQTQMHDEKAPENLSLIEKIKFYNEVFKPTSRYSLPDRIVRSFAYQAGFDTFEQLERTTIESVKNKEKISKERARELEQGKILTLEEGDFVRGIGTIESFGSSLNNGNICKEFLGAIIGTSDSDTTPLDTDFTRILSSGKNIYQNIEGSPTGFGFGNIFIILKKDNPEINITRDSNGNLIESEYQPDKIEMFGSKTEKGGYESHWGARTGIASSDIDYILFKERRDFDSKKPYLESGDVNYVGKQIDDNDLAILKNEIAKNGFYIPVVDFSGKLIFTVKEYEDLREKMEGLSYYGSKEYHLKEEKHCDYVDQVKSLISSERANVKEQSDKVYGALKEAFGSVDAIDKINQKLEVRNTINPDITPGSVEVIETGSSARGTNIPYEYDFDYIVRVDTERLKRPEKLKEINESICDELSVENVPNSDFRDVSATVPELGEIKLDITYVNKTNKMEYSTEMSAKERIDTIEHISPEMKDEVVANIVLAKMLMKKNGCYKPRRKSEEQGGLGGIGIENWIVQNGGTLDSAARSFLKAAEGKDFDEFKLTYHVHDYGRNHMAENRGNYPYNDFVFDNMNNNGYIKMKTALGKYISYVEGKTTSLPEIDEYLDEIRTKSKSSTISNNQELNDMLKTENNPSSELKSESTK